MIYDLKPLFDMQHVLDDRIVEEKELDGQNLLQEKILALQVELAECANEWRGFKFWSENREPRKKAVRNPQMFEEDKEYYNPLLEEYVDCLHFILSIGLEHEIDDGIEGLAIEPIQFSSVVEQFSSLMAEDWYNFEFGSGAYYHSGLELFIGLGEMLGFTWDQIVQAYKEKHAINIQRQNNGY